MRTALLDILAARVLDSDVRVLLTRMQWKWTRTATMKMRILEGRRMAGSVRVGGIRVRRAACRPTNHVGRVRVSPRLVGPSAFADPLRSAVQGSADPAGPGPPRLCEAGQRWGRGPTPSPRPFFGPPAFPRPSRSGSSGKRPAALHCNIFTQQAYVKKPSRYRMVV
jgi:hypothetical protein